MSVNEPSTSTVATEPQTTFTRLYYATHHGAYRASKGSVSTVSYGFSLRFTTTRGLPGAPGPRCRSASVPGRRPARTVYSDIEWPAVSSLKVGRTHTHLHMHICLTCASIYSDYNKEHVVGSLTCFK
jgi:hypothetical protein